MDQNIDYALMIFINERPEGNLLRDIAIRTLQDNRRSAIKYRPKKYACKRLKSIRPKRILPSIKYRPMKMCGHNWRTN